MESHLSRSPRNSPRSPLERPLLDNDILESCLPDGEALSSPVGEVLSLPEKRVMSFRGVGGLLLHAASLQFVLTGMQSLLYGVLLGYLNVPGRVYSVADMLIGSRPFSFTVVWGAVSDVDSP